MLRPLIVGCVTAALCISSAAAHAIFPGSQKISTMGDRAIVQLHAVNSRRDVSTFAVEVFDDNWVPARNAVAWPQKLTVLAPDEGATEASESLFSVMVDISGKSEQRLRVCTKSIPNADSLLARRTVVNTRVCSNVLVQRFQR